MRKLAIATCALVAHVSGFGRLYSGRAEHVTKAIVSGVGNGQTIQFTGGQQFSLSFTTHDLVAFEGASFTMGYTGGPLLLASQFPLGDSVSRLRCDVRSLRQHPGLDLQYSDVQRGYLYPHGGSARYDRAGHPDDDRPRPDADELVA